MLLIIATPPPPSNMTNYANYIAKHANMTKQARSSIPRQITQHRELQNIT